MLLKPGKSLLLCLMVLLLVSCTKRERFTDQERLKIKIHAARLGDVPIPLGAIPILDYMADDSFGYLISNQFIDLLEYYTVQMDQFGWSLLGVFDSVEQVLVFEKPYKLLSIIIRKQEDQRLVVILTKDK